VKSVIKSTVIKENNAIFEGFLHNPKKKGVLFLGIKAKDFLLTVSIF